MNNHMYMAPVNYRQIEQFPGYGGQDSRLWGGFGWGRPWGWGFGSPFFGAPFGFGMPFGFGFGFPFFGGFPFFI
ncbi:MULTISPECIES: hypothetical protein [Bacillaceae]|uniref:hypothetical protein n=1 Tax=Bacillaceae TaxID=186817 RepID=UPI002FFE12A8